MEQTHDQNLLRNTINSSLDMIQVFEAVRNDEGVIIDFIWILINQSSEKVYGDVIGKSLLTLNPGVVTEGIFDQLKRVVETGVSDQSVRHYIHEQFNGWFLQSSVKQGDGVATTTKDITAIKEAELRKERNKDLLQKIIDAPGIGMAVYKAIRNHTGEIVDFLHEYINQASIRMLGEDYTGKLFTHHGENAVLQMPQLTAVIQSGRPNNYVREANFRGKKVWFAVSNSPLDDDRLVHTWEDITERKNAEAEINRLKDEIATQAQDKYQAIFNSINEGFSLLEVQYDEHGQANDVIICDANPAQDRIDGAHAMIGKRVWKVHADMKQIWIERYANIVRTGRPEQFEEWSEDNQRWYRINASRVGNEGSSLIAVVYDDITEKKQQESKQSYLLRFTDAIRPIEDPIAIQSVAATLLGEQLTADRAYYVEIDENAGEFIIATDWHRPGTLSQVRSYPSHDWPITSLTHGKTWIVNGINATLIVPLLKHNRLSAFFVIQQKRSRTWSRAEIKMTEETADRTWWAVEKAKGDRTQQLQEIELAKSEKKYRTLFESIDEGFAVMELQRNAEGVVTDLIYREVNRAFKRFTGWEHPVNKRGTLLMPHLERSLLYQMQIVADTGKSFRKEDYVADLDRWFDVHYSSIDKPGSNFIVAVFKDTTERKRHERKQEFILLLSEAIQTHMLPADIQHATLEVLRKYLQGSRTLYTEPVGQQRDMHITSESRKPGLAPLEGQLFDFEHYIPGGIDEALAGKPLWRTNVLGAVHNLVQNTDYGTLDARAWLMIPLVKNGKLIAALTIHSDEPRIWTPEAIAIAQEATERIWSAVERAKAEQAVRKSEEQLRLFITASSNMVYKMSADWKEMYTLTGKNILADTHDPTGDWVERYIPADERTVVWQTIDEAIADKDIFMLEHRVFQADRALGWVLSRAVPVLDDDGRITEWFGTSIDITLRKNAEIQVQQFNESLEQEVRDRTAELARQKGEVFRVSLSLLEEERQRISESLHNGIGQLLYGVKINLSRLTIATESAKFDETKVYVSKLLTEAIDESRRISHQLMPATLEEFGLKSAIKNICQQLEGGTKFSLTMGGQHIRMKKYLELAIYRTVQELMTNVVKHAKATECKVHIVVASDLINLTISDNGSGMKDEKSSKRGIGLASIRSRIKLLDGEVKIHSVAERGTTIKISIPRPDAKV